MFPFLKRISVSFEPLFFSFILSVTPIFKAFVNTLNFNHLAFYPSFAVDILADRLREELANHLWLGCAKREGAAADVVEFSELMVARVIGVTIHLEGDIQELLLFFSHNFK